MKNLAFIPVRGGSKSIELKNIKQFCGKPLVYWTAFACENCEEIDEVIIATDSEEIKNCVLAFGFKKISIYMREAENASDTSSTESVLLEYIQKKKPASHDALVLVQATSPFTSSENISDALKLYKKGYDSLLSCARSKRFIWNENGTPLNYDYNNRPRRQDFKGTLIENGALYINKIENIILHQNRVNGSIALFEMPEYTFTELDEPEDWYVGEKIMRKHSPLFKEPTKKNIRILLSDVDGVLTDAGMYYTENGDEFKKFNTYDGMAFEILRQNGIKGGIITKEDRQLVKRRALKLKLDYEYSGINNKLEILKEICDKEQISFSQVAYIGDDINDVEVLKVVGLAACPANARNEVKEIPGIIQLETSGGNGVIRELISHII